MGVLEILPLRAICDIGSQCPINWMHNAYEGVFTRVAMDTKVDPEKRLYKVNLRQKNLGFWVNLI